MKKRGRPPSTAIKLTEREAALLRECRDYDISTVSGDFYRLGGFGCAKIKFNASSLPRLQTRGLVDNQPGYWKTTDAGISALAEHEKDMAGGA